MIVSFIIPAYNASTTIVRCLDSIYTLGLSEQEFEVICIDDCSTDNTIKVIEQYAKQHTNLTLLSQIENHRQGAARNRGVAIAKGKYIVYVDSDDESDKGVVNALRLAEKNDLDMVAMHYVNVDQHGNITEKEPITLDGVFTGVELQIKHSNWCSGPVPYVYNAFFLKSVNYPFSEDVLFEDADYVIVHLHYAKRLMYEVSCGYKIHFNTMSTTHTLTYRHCTDYFMLGTRILDFFNSLDNKTTEYALFLLEDGSHGIWNACRRLIKLSSLTNVYAFYDYLDKHVERKSLIHYNQPAYCWTWWTKICLKHKRLAIILIAIGQWIYKLKNII